MSDPISWGLLASIKKLVKSVKTSVDNIDLSPVTGAVEDIATDLGQDMDELVANVGAEVDEMKEAVENMAVGVPAPSMYSLTAQSTDDGIQLSYSVHTGTSADGGEMSTSELVPLSVTKGVMFRYKEGTYPTHRNDGTLAFIDEDLFNVGSGGGKVKKTKTQTVVGLTNGKTYYFTAFPYSTYNLYNESMGSKNCISCAWTGTKGTLTVTITQDYDYKTLGEITVTATPASGDESPVTKSRTGPGDVTFSLEGNNMYRLSFSTEQYFTKPQNQSVTVYAGQPNTASAEYKIIVGLENYTWEEVQAIAAGGDAKHFFSVGEKKTTSVGTVGNSSYYGTIYTDGQIERTNIVLKNLEATIVAINAHQTTSGTKNNVTFCVLDMPLHCEDQTRSMNWSQSCLRTCLNERKSEFLPEIHQYLIEVYNTLAGFDVYDDDTGRKSYRCNDYIYVPSISNASSASATYDVMEEKAGGTHYPYFSSNEKRTLKSWEKEGTKTWVTSTVQSGEGYLVDISASGFVYFSNLGSNDYITADVTWKPICFNIG